jgi:hypothetical protein
VLVRVWEYDVRPTSTEEFVRIYAADGEWARLFALSDGYAGTELFVSVDRPSRFLTVDRFSSADAWRTFLAEHQAAYTRLDAACADLTTSEHEVAAVELPAEVEDSVQSRDRPLPA